MSDSSLTRKDLREVPSWLSRVETDQTRALLRASSEFARAGYAPFLKKAKDAAGEDIAIVESPRARGMGRPSAMGCVRAWPRTL